MVSQQRGEIGRYGDNKSLSCTTLKIFGSNITQRKELLSICLKYYKLLKDFSREVIRSQLPNVYVFGEQYFKELFETLGAFLYAAVVENITKALAEIDIKQTEFLAKVAAHALDTAQANGPQRHTQERPCVHIFGKLHDEFESTLTRKLDEHEAVGNGVLDRPSIRYALKDREVGLTRREVNLIMEHLERKYPDGTFDVNDVAHEAFELLFEAYEDNLLQLPLNEQAVHAVLKNLQFQKHRMDYL
ncbi:MAG: hypothetical protein EZS28_027788 [Streblomastix strix]|uniref:Uncharacterized protein n=1 Tax=Streblomastix strix TaxID=222440 RepID=A0A5J4V145_9EUKA|nr:MAG: hypothetical protein EZS28_027788 [Streblomastix strix]